MWTVANKNIELTSWTLFIYNSIKSKQTNVSRIVCYAIKIQVITFISRDRMEGVLLFLHKFHGKKFSTHVFLPTKSPVKTLNGPWLFQNDIIIK